MASTNTEELPTLNTSKSKGEELPGLPKIEKKESSINILEKRLSDKFEEFSNKRTSTKTLISRDRPTEILQVNQVSRVLKVLEGRINAMEKHFLKKSGFVFGLIAAFLMAAICTVSETVGSNLPAIEILFITMLISFLLNYYLIRDGEVLPYIENESENFRAKVSGVSGLASAVLFIYSFQQCELTTSIYCAAFAWIIFALFSQCSKNLTQKLNSKQLIFGIVMVALTFVILMPNFQPEFTEIDTPADDTDVDPNLKTDDKHMYGVITAFASGLCFGYMTYCFRQLKNNNFITITHIFTYIQAPFVPVFFPVQKLISPTLPQWGFLIILGIFFLIVIQFQIRCSQLVNPNQSLLVIPQFIAIFTILSLPAGLSTYGSFSIISFIAAILIIVLCYFFAAEIGKGTNGTALPVESNNGAKTAQQDIPLQTFTKKDNLSLSQKLLDNEH